MDDQRRLSIWLKGLSIYLFWSGTRAVYFTVLGQFDPELQLAVDRGFGPAVTIGQTVCGVLGIGAAIAVWQRMPWAIPLTLTVLAIDASLTWFGILQFRADPGAVREAYAASREARGLPIPDERLDVLFSPEAFVAMCVIGALMTVVPLAILLWRSWELAPEPERRRQS
jgi:hypothetical protein